MKQISLKQAQELATRDAYKLKAEIEYCQEDWIKEHARYIADIETKRIDKTYYGEWPKGWKHEMKRAAVEKAKQDLLTRFLRNECKQLDGAIWLGNWQMIKELEKPTQTV
jgi:hypothetical protein